MRRTSKPQTAHPSAEGTLHYDAAGKRCAMAQFLPKPEPKSYTVSVAAMCEHLAAVTKWLRATEAA